MATPAAAPVNGSVRVVVSGSELVSGRNPVSVRAPTH